MTKHYMHAGRARMANEEMKELELAEQLKEEAREMLQRYQEPKDAQSLLCLVRDLAYDSGWLAAKLELGHSDTPESDNLNLRTLIERRNIAFRQLAAALAGEEGRDEG